VGEGGDEVSVARFIADQRTNYRVPHAKTCQWLGMSESWFYKWLQRADDPAGLHTATDRRRAEVDAAVAAAFTAARGLHGSPRLWADLLDQGWQISEKTVAESMRRQGLVARKIKRRNGLTRQDKTAPKFPDLVKRDFAAATPNTKWVGDITEIPTRAGKLYLATVIDLYSRRLLGAATGLHPDADLACQAIKMAVAARGGVDNIRGVIFHTDRGSTYTADTFTALCHRLGIRQSMGRVGSCFDNAAAEAFFSSLEWEVLSRNDFVSTRQAQAVVIEWCYGFYNHQRRHSAAGGLSPTNYETAALTRDAA
jgi:transposase InsO family protein